jgi:hypothetical protein
MKIQLSDNDLEQLMRPVRGQGGWQSLVRRLQRQVQGNVIELSREDQERILHYLLSYGTGGWQERISSVVPRSRAKRPKPTSQRPARVVTG